MPAYHISGIQTLVRFLVGGVDSLVTDVTNGFNITDFTAKTHELASTGDRVYTSLAPNQLAKAMDTLAGTRCTWCVI